MIILLLFLIFLTLLYIAGFFGWIGDIFWEINYNREQTILDRKKEKNREILIDKLKSFLNKNKLSDNLEMIDLDKISTIDDFESLSNIIKEQIVTYDKFYNGSIDKIYLNDENIEKYLGFISYNGIKKLKDMVSEDDPKREAVLLNEDGILDTRNTVLIINKDIFLLHMYGRKAVKGSFNTYILTTVNGNFIQKVIHINPDIIYLDIIFSGRDGFSALKLLKNDSRTMDIPVIILTNQSSKKEVEEALNVGVLDYIVMAYCKPNVPIEKYSSYLKKPKKYERWIDDPVNNSKIE